MPTEREGPTLVELCDGCGWLRNIIGSGYLCTHKDVEGLESWIEDDPRLTPAWCPCRKPQGDAGETLAKAVEAWFYDDSFAEFANWLDNSHMPSLASTLRNLSKEIKAALAAYHAQQPKEKIRDEPTAM